MTVTLKKSATKRDDKVEVKDARASDSEIGQGPEIKDGFGPGVDTSLPSPEASQLPAEPVEPVEPVEVDRAKTETINKANRSQADKLGEAQQKSEKAAREARNWDPPIEISVKVSGMVPQPTEVIEVLSKTTPADRSVILEKLLQQLKIELS